MAIPRFIQLIVPGAILPIDVGIVPPKLERPHAVIDPSALKAAMAIPRFIQLSMPLPLLKPMVQSRRGVPQMLEAQVRPLTVAIPRFIHLSPHAVIEPSA
jgi:hypothetical protein